MADLEQHEYELVYILQPELDEQGLSNLNDRLAQLVSDQEGTMTNTELWGRRTLAYPIRKYFEGTYVLHRFQMPPQSVVEVDRLLHFNENVIRYLMIRTDN